jgi:hypothetical protein
MKAIELLQKHLHLKVASAQDISIIKEFGPVMA